MIFAHINGVEDKKKVLGENTANLETINKFNAFENERRPSAQQKMELQDANNLKNNTRECAKIITLYSKAKTLQNSCLDACVVHTFKFFFMLYKCSIWRPPTAQHQANMRIFRKCATACQSTPCSFQLSFNLSCHRYLLEVVEHKLCC